MNGDYNNVKKYMKRFTILIWLMAAMLQLSAQVTVEASIDSIEMLIGQQVHVTVTATAGEQTQPVFPEYKPQQMVTPGVEVLGATEVKKKPIDNGQARFTRVYTLTSFDGNLYYLPPFTVKVGGKAYESKSLALKVIEIEVDTTKMEQFFGPKDVQDNPFLWSDWSLVFWLSVLMLLLATLGYYLYIRLRDNKPIIAHIKVVKRLLPHQKAMKEIEVIKAEKMVSSEDQKEYYTRLTETLRKYIEERYGFSAMEMTSSEIIDRLMASQDEQSLDELRRLFMTADLVKFAKYSTLINENDMNLVNAIEFINQTKLEALATEEVVKPQLTAEEERSVKTRRTLKVVITAIAFASIALFGYVLTTIYLLIN